MLHRRAPTATMTVDPALAPTAIVAVVVAAKVDVGSFGISH